MGPNSSCMLVNRVPWPISSRMPPRISRITRKPSPIMKPSSAAGSTGFLLAKASARPSTVQLVTISGMKMPRISYSSKVKACIIISITVTMAAMIITKAGRRTASVTYWRISDTQMLEPISTTRVARPRPRALTTVPVTASSGHRPRICTVAGLLFHSPSMLIFL